MAQTQHPTNPVDALRVDFTNALGALGGRVTSVEDEVFDEDGNSVVELHTQQIGDLYVDVDRLKHLQAQDWRDINELHGDPAGGYGKATFVAVLTFVVMGWYVAFSHDGVDGLDAWLATIGSAIIAFGVIAFIQTSKRPTAPQTNDDPDGTATQPTRTGRVRNAWRNSNRWRRVHSRRHQTPTDSNPSGTQPDGTTNS